nr:hypothetical protein [Tanacetum cinerariifolium]
MLGKGDKCFSKAIEGENIFTLLRNPEYVSLLLLTAWRESHASHYDRAVPRRKYLRTDMSCQGYKTDTDTEKGSFWKSKRYLRWVEAVMVSPEVENKKWRRFLLHWMCDTFGASSGGRKEDSFTHKQTAVVV